MWRYLSCCLLIALPAYAQDITGDLNTNIGDNTNVDSNNQSSTTNNNYNATGAGQAAPVMSAISPTITGGGGNDSCLIPKTQGIQLSIMGASSGGMEQDPKCNRRKDARLMGTPQQVGGLGLQVSGISIMCSDAVVFKAMLLANTPCPVMDVDRGALAMGRDAIRLYRRQPEIFVVGYAQDRAFYDAVLKIGQELEDVQETTVTKYEPLSAQFRGSRSGRRAGQDKQPDQQPNGD
jgi:hypothetical protein